MITLTLTLTLTGHVGRGDNLNPNLNDNYAMRGVEVRGYWL